MTSAIHSLGMSRRPVRAAAAAAVLAGVLTLTACGGGDSGSDAGSTAPASPTASAASTGTGAVGGGSTAAAASGLEGSWLATADGKPVALIVTGTQAALFATGGTVCSGTAGEEAGMKMIHLACTTGSKDRTTGMVGSLSGDSMKVTWSGKAGEETYTKADDGRLPSGLPTAGAATAGAATGS